MKIRILYSDVQKTMFQESLAIKLLKSGQYENWEVIIEVIIDDNSEKYKEFLEKDIDEQLEIIFASANVPEDVYKKYLLFDLTTRKNQEIIAKSKGKHTSMSVGDIVQINDSSYMCLNFGFKDITSLVTDHKFRNLHEENTFKPKWVLPPTDHTETQRALY